jgi:hypothetical protein
MQPVQPVQQAAFNPVLGAVNAPIAMSQFLNQLWGNGYARGLQGGGGIGLGEDLGQVLRDIVQGLKDIRASQTLLTGVVGEIRERLDRLEVSVLEVTEQIDGARHQITEVHRRLDRIASTREPATRQEPTPQWPGVAEVHAADFTAPTGFVTSVLESEQSSRCEAQRVKGTLLKVDGMLKVMLRLFPLIRTRGTQNQKIEFVFAEACVFVDQLREHNEELGHIIDVKSPKVGVAPGIKQVNHASNNCFLYLTTICFANSGLRCYRNACLTGVRSCRGK